MKNKNLIKRYIDYLSNIPIPKDVKDILKSFSHDRDIKYYKYCYISDWDNIEESEFSDEELEDIDYIFSKLLNEHIYVDEKESKLIKSFDIFWAWLTDEVGMIVMQDNENTYVFIEDSELIIDEICKVADRIM